MKSTKLLPGYFAQQHNEMGTYYHTYQQRYIAVLTNGHNLDNPYGNCIQKLTKKDSIRKVVLRLVLTVDKTFTTKGETSNPTYTHERTHRLPTYNFQTKINKSIYRQNYIPCTLPKPPRPTSRFSKFFNYLIGYSKQLNQKDQTT